ncbi:MAG: response regulator [Acidobacteria bacterium]|nr:response regulator [Acidobacteriota bacterium]
MSPGEDRNAKLRILVIEDDDQTRRMLVQMMARAGYDVREAQNGRVGIEKVRGETVDLVVTDILMPEQDGLETIRDLRALFPAIPIIAISGGGHDGILDFLPVARQLGARRTFRKPTDRAALLEAVREELALVS